MSIDFIHHVGLLPPGLDLDQATAKFERLGFQLTPASRIEASVDGDPRYIGLSNRTAVFGTNYLELVGATDPDIWARVPPQGRGAFNVDERLADHPGLHILVFGTHDIETTRGQLVAAGHAMSPIAHLQREVETTKGPAKMQARVLFYAEPPDPDAIISVAQHDTPQVIFQSCFQPHPNGALDITEVILSAADPRTAANRHAARVALAAHDDGDHYSVDLPTGRLIFARPETLIRDGLTSADGRSGLVAIRIAVATLETTATWFDQAHVPYDWCSIGLIVGSAEAAGSILIFSEVRP